MILRHLTFLPKLFILVICFAFTSAYQVFGQSPSILKESKIYLPDFSYAGYKNGLEDKGRFEGAKVIDVRQHGAIPNDGLDDSFALIAALKSVEQENTPVIIQLEKGQYILSEILYISRSNIILRGTGSGAFGTTIYCPRPMKYLEDPESLQELREYLVKFDKTQREKENNINLPFSQYAWSGGMIWVRKKGTRVKSYLPEFKQEKTTLAKLVSGKRGSLTAKVSSTQNINVGEVIQLEWYNKAGEEGSLIDEIYQTRDIKIGSHHWNFPDEPLVKQQVRIEAIKGNQITLSSPLLMDIKPEWNPLATKWEHLEQIGIEHLSIKFPMAEKIAHHVEEGFNGIYLTRLYDGWVDDVKIDNSDAGILTEETANVTISNIETIGDKLAHYSVYIGGVHNVLVDGLRVANEVRHPLSFNTFSTKNVFTNAEVLVNPILDQHAGANHQNLFDNIKVHVKLDGKAEYPLFSGGGAGYWKPSHGSYNTFWNIEVHFLDGLEEQTAVLLNGMSDGPNARIIGVHANKPVKVVY
ncbi:MAG: hypothetical protein RIA69_03825, partial [Cyclobacteriaceae bacterium]